MSALLTKARPPQADLRRAHGAADRLAALLALLAWCCTLATLIGFPGPDALFKGGAPAICAVASFPALLGMFVEPFRNGFARLLMGLAAAALLALGALYLGDAPTGRVVVGYFVPALLLAGAALVLAAPALRRAST